MRELKKASSSASSAFPGKKIWRKQTQNCRSCTREYQPASYLGTTEFVRTARMAAQPALAGSKIGINIQGSTGRAGSWCRGGIFLPTPPLGGWTSTLYNDRANLAERKHAIPWDHLPILFRQALEFTYRLGAEYLWIDSLRILQGDELDWSVESKKMAGIYQNSKLTLAASWAENSNEDMFSSPKESVLGIRVEGLEKVGVVDDIYVCVKLAHMLEQFPLLNRAWVYQERLLSPRYLHFSPVELICECNAEILCLCSGKDVTSERCMRETVEGRFAETRLCRGIEWDKERKVFKLRCKRFSWDMISQEFTATASRISKTDFLQLLEGPQNSGSWVKGTGTAAGITA